MKHQEAIQHLPRLDPRAPGSSEEVAALRHADRCAECSGWLDTRDLLASRLAGGRRHPRRHPDGTLLALIALRPEEVHEPDRQELRGHLEGCASCRDHVDRVRLAVRDARPPGLVPAARPRYSRALAAGLGICLLGGGLFAARILMVTDGDPTLIVRSTNQVSAPVSRPAPEEQLTGRSLEGKQHFENEGSLSVSEVTVERGADVTFWSGEVVAFGSGFRVADGARLRVGSDRPHQGAQVP